MTDLMGCGHTANATQGGKPVCVICIGLNTGATQVVQGPSLMGRQSKCTYCGSTVPSSYSLPFFELARPGQGFDGHYDGCRGWD